jgi:diguanylate cyclase (GGDEF)-like protein
MLGEASIETGGSRISIRASVGVAAFTERMETPANLIAAADEALYLAKDLGRDRTELYVGAAALA